MSEWQAENDEDRALVLELMQDMKRLAGHLGPSGLSDSLHNVADKELRTISATRPAGTPSTPEAE